MNTQINHPYDPAETILGSLREEGFRMTPQRIAILKILASSDQHLSAEELYKVIIKDFPTSSLATIYKTLNALKNAGHLLEISLPSSPSKYDLKHAEPHPHLICNLCHSIWDADQIKTKDLTPEVAKEYGFIRVTQRLDFYGICPDCQTLIG